MAGSLMLAAGNDLDLNDAVLLLPDQPGPHPHLAVTAGKEGTVYVLDRDNLGKNCTSCTAEDAQIVQEFPQVAKATGSLLYWNGMVYATGTGYPILAWAVKNGLLSSTPVAQTPPQVGGHSPIITSAGTANGILWQINGTILTAYNSTTLVILYVTSQTNGRDALPPIPHFAQLMVANGKLYIGTNGGVTVFGLL